MNENTNKIRSNSFTEEDRKDTLLSMVAYGSNTIMQLSKQISETSELLHTLYESKDRTIEIVNS